MASREGAEGAGSREQLRDSLGFTRLPVLNQEVAQGLPEAVLRQKQLPPRSSNLWIAWRTALGSVRSGRGMRELSPASSPSCAFRGSAGSMTPRRLLFLHALQTTGMD